MLHLIIQSYFNLKKHMKNTIRAIFFLLMATAIMSGCKKHKNDPAPSVVETAPLSFHLHTYIGETEVDAYNIVYRDDNNRKISLSRAQLYISNIELVKYDGSIYNVDGVILSVKQDNEVYSVANVPVGNYKSVNFYVGIDSVQNAQVASGNSPLNDSTMWFNKTAQPNGYIFMSCIGKVDTTAAMNASDADMTPFTYNIGMNVQLKKVSMPVQNYTVALNTTTFIHMTMDYAQLFDGVNLLDQSNLSITSESDNTWTGSGGTWPISVQVGANIPKMFKYEN